MSAQQRQRILILGGGFGGIYVAMHLDKMLARDPDIEVILINQDNFFLFTPMLHEVASCDLDITHIVNPVRKLLRHVQVFVGDVDAIDPVARRVTVSHGSDHHTHDLEYDHLVLALGCVTNFYHLPGLQQNALTMKTLGDAIHLRNRLISHLEEADSECAAGNRDRQLTFVVAGGGFAGVETIAAINDFAREALRYYTHLTAKQLHMVLVHSGDLILPELGPKLGAYAQEQLRQRGVDIRTGLRVTSAGPEWVTLSDGTRIETQTLIWTAGTSPHPLLGSLPCPQAKGRVAANEFLEVPEWPGVWALGDCACITDPATGQPYPPTAQHAIRQAKILAGNLTATVRGGQKRPFVFKTIGQLAAIGRRTGVARVFGINFSGFTAWWMWRTIYLSKLPRFEKKVRVALDWTLDLLFSKDIVQFLTARSPGINRIDALDHPLDQSMDHPIDHPLNQSMDQSKVVIHDRAPVVTAPTAGSDAVQGTTVRETTIQGTTLQGISHD
jgi:NADH dehydrogenase